MFAVSGGNEAATEQSVGRSTHTNAKEMLTMLQEQACIERFNNLVMHECTIGKCKLETGETIKQLRELLYILCSRGVVKLRTTHNKCGIEEYHLSHQFTLHQAQQIIFCLLTCPIFILTILPTEVLFALLETIVTHLHKECLIHENNMTESLNNTNCTKNLSERVSIEADVFVFLHFAWRVQELQETICGLLTDDCVSEIYCKSPNINKKLNINTNESQTSEEKTSALLRENPIIVLSRLNRLRRELCINDKVSTNAESVYKRAALGNDVNISETVLNTFDVLSKCINENHKNGTAIAKHATEMCRNSEIDEQNDVLLRCKTMFVDIASKIAKEITTIIERGLADRQQEEQHDNTTNKVKSLMENDELEPRKKIL